MARTTAFIVSFVVAIAVLVLAVGAFVPHFGPSIFSFGATSVRLRMLAAVVMMYRDQHGAYPDPHGDWMAALADAQGEATDLFKNEINDGWDNPCMYETPTGASTPIVRSIGANGVDDGGHLDDLTLAVDSQTIHVNDGQYERKYYGILRAAALPALILGSWWVVTVLRHSPLREHAVLLLGVPASIALIALERLTEVHTCTGYSSPFPPDIVALTFLAICIAWEFSSRMDRLPPPFDTEYFKCPECGYDQRGLPTPICPECGMQQVSPPPMRESGE